MGDPLGDGRREKVGAWKLRLGAGSIDRDDGSVQCSPVLNFVRPIGSPAAAAISVVLRVRSPPPMFCVR